MNFSFYIARRYLFAKRSTNAINIITGISVLAIAIGTAALILVLSVFNGFEDLLSGLFGYFDPQVKITPAKGKTFPADSVLLSKIRSVPGVLYASETLEEIAFFEYGNAQDFATLKGVDKYFHLINGIDSTVQEGKYYLTEEDRNYAVVGAGVYNKLSVSLYDKFATMTVYMPLEQSGVLDKPFKTRYLYPAGMFSIQQDYDNEFVISSLDFAREILQADSTEVSSIEIKCTPDADISQIKNTLKSNLGEGFTIRDRFEQNEAFFKVMNLEKRMGFAITSLIMLLLAFNMIGALWMLVLDKQKDIATLKGMGASDKTVRNIFLMEGFLLTGLGLFLGFLLAIILYAAQKYFGLVSVPSGFITTSYPISMRIADFLPVALVVLLIGLLASWLPARRAELVRAFIREE